ETITKPVEELHSPVYSRPPQEKRQSSYGTHVDHHADGRRTAQGLHSDRESKSSSDKSAGAANRRSMVWQPGLIPTYSTQGQPSRPADTREIAEQFIHQHAQQQQMQLESRQRYVHTRKSSGDLLRSGTPSPGITPSRSPDPATHPPRPKSQNAHYALGMTAPAPLIADVGSQLSAREQEYVAKMTGTTLVQLEKDPHKKRPHQAGLLGAIESRERERNEMRKEYGNLQAGSNATVKHAPAKIQAEKVKYRRSHSPGPSMAYGGHGRNHSSNSLLDLVQPQSTSAASRDRLDQLNGPTNFPTPASGAYYTPNAVPTPASGA